MQAASLFATAQVAFRPKHWELRLDDLVFQALVITFGVIVRDELRYRSVHGRFSYSICSLSAGGVFRWLKVTRSINCATGNSGMMKSGVPLTAAPGIVRDRPLDFRHQRPMKRKSRFTWLNLESHNMAFSAKRSTNPGERSVLKYSRRADAEKVLLVALWVSMRRMQ